MTILLVDNDLYFIKNIFNVSLNNFKEVQIQFIATNIEECLSILSQNDIDFIILNINIIKERKIFNQKLSQLNFVKKPHIFFFSSPTSETEYKEIEKRLKNKIISITLENIQPRIIAELSNLGYNWKYKGTHYLLQSIVYIYIENNISLLANLEKNVYPHISSKNSTSINNIKTGIIKATNLLNSTDYKFEKPTPKQIISNILTKYMNFY